MKNLILFCLLLLLTSICYSQTTNINGTVADEQGKPIAFAFIKDAAHNYATYSDPNGNFNLKADPSSRLLVTATDFRTTVVSINNQSSVKVVMTAGTPAASSTNSKSNDVFQEDGTGKSGGVIGYFSSHQEDLHGSRYFFSYWGHGYAITMQDSLKQNDNYHFNYEKLSGTLLYTDDGKVERQIVKSLIKEFVLFDNDGQSYMFENVPAIDERHYVQVLSNGPKYKIYKQLNSKFIAANFTTNGITSSGNNYDEYLDEPVFYLEKLPGGKPDKLLPKRKALKVAFAADAEKLNKYFSTHEDAEVDDNFLKDLGDYLNN